MATSARQSLAPPHWNKHGTPASGQALDRHALNRSLGWFSIGLGVTQLLAPKTLGQAIGVGDRSVVMRLCGVREIASGLGLLSGRAPATFATARVAGDMMDLGLLAAALGSSQANPTRIAAAATAVASVAALDLYATKLGAQAAVRDAPVETPLSTSLTINSSPDKLYQYWHELENLPRFMRHVKSVETIDERTSRWTANGPRGMRVQWRSEIVDDQPNRLIAWRTLPDSDVAHRGSVRFDDAPGGRGTVVRVDMHYSAPAGHLTAYAAKVLGAAPETSVRADLRRLKQLIEAGEVPTTRGQPSGARSLVGKTVARARHGETA